MKKSFVFFVNFQFDGLILFLDSVSSTVRVDGKQNVFTIDNITKTAKLSIIEGLKEEANKKDSDSSNKNSSSTDNKTTDTKVIGSEEYGYVKVPKDWVDFKDINGGNDIQSSDTSSYNVVTLNIFRPNQLGISEAEYASIDPKQVANSVYTKHKNSQMFEKMSGTKSKIGGYDAYVINTLTNTGKYFITYIFKADDGKIHYTSIEGDKDTVTKMIPLLEESWSLKK